MNRWMRVIVKFLTEHDVGLWVVTGDVHWKAKFRPYSESIHSAELCSSVLAAPSKWATVSSAPRAELEERRWTNTPLFSTIHNSSLVWIKFFVIDTVLMAWQGHEFALAYCRCSPFVSGPKQRKIASWPYTKRASLAHKQMNSHSSFDMGPMK